jgi:hypothetical protein
LNYSTTPSPSTSAPASGVQLGSGCPCHHNLGRPAPAPPDDCDDGTPPAPRSQRISSSPPSKPFADKRAGFPKTAPMELLLLLLPLVLVLGEGGRWTRRNGRGDACAARRQWRVKADWETRSAIGGGSFATAVESSSGTIAWGTRRDSDSDSDSGGLRGSMPVVLVAAAYLYTTPSSSRKYAGPIFLFSALHCARTRNLLRFAIEQPIGATVASRARRSDNVEVGP